MITFFKSITDTENPYYETIPTALSRIRTGRGSRGVVEAIRAGDTDKKKLLPCVLFSGKFSKRSKDGLIEHSGFIVLDFDKEKDPQAKKEALSKSDYIYAAWISPSGEGVKALVKIDGKRHEESFISLTKFFQNVDKSGKDVSRVCFESYDPSIYINIDSKTFTPSVVPQKSKDEFVKNWGKVNQALSKIDGALDGEKHMVLLKISRLFGGWVGSGDIGEDSARNLLRGAIERKPNVESLEQAYRTIEDGLQNGRQKPLHMQEQKDILNMRVGIGNLFVSAENVAEDAFMFAENGYEPGDACGWSIFNKHYTILQGSTTYVYGAPYSGKSQLMHEVYVGQASFFGKKGALMSTETGTPAQIFAELASIKMQKSLDKRTGSSFSESEFWDAYEFINDYFWVIDPQEKELRVKDFYDQVMGVEREFNVKIDFTSIDPFNRIDTDYDAGRHDKKLGKELDYMLFDARSNNRHNFMITHIRDQVMQKSGDQYYYPKPTPRDVYDGQQFFRKGMGMISVWRPIDVNGRPLNDKDGVPYRANTTIVDIQKEKPKGVGKTGSFELYYDKRKNCYYEMPFVGNGDALEQKFYIGEFNYEEKTERESGMGDDPF